MMSFVYQFGIGGNNIRERERERERKRELSIELPLIRNTKLYEQTGSQVR